MDNKNELERQVETLREWLKASVRENGYTHHETVKISQKLDLLLNELQKKIT